MYVSKGNTNRTAKQYKRDVIDSGIRQIVRKGGPLLTPWEYKKLGNAQSDAFLERDLEELLGRTQRLELENPMNELLPLIRQELEQLLDATHILQSGEGAPERGRIVLLDRWDKVREVLTIFK